MVGPIVELWDCLRAWRERKWKTHFGARSSEGKLGSGWNVGIVWITNCLCCRGHHFLLDIVLSELGWMVTLTQLRICSVHGICISACGLRAEWPKHRLGLHSEMIQCILSYLKPHYLNLFHLSFFKKNLMSLHVFSLKFKVSIGCKPFPECAMVTMLEDLILLCSLWYAKQEKAVAKCLLKNSVIYYLGISHIQYI